VVVGFNSTVFRGRFVMTAVLTPTPLVASPPVEELESEHDVEMGFGPCSDCPCQGFAGSDPSSVCTNCGHHYDRHA
jgi:hypothetical protein